MARRRLGPADPASLTLRPAPQSVPETRAKPPFPTPPIAQVAGDAAKAAAFDEVSRELTEARDSGRLLLDLPLDVIIADHLARDRILADDDDLLALRESIQAHGQRTPIEVTPLDDGPGGEARYGLISGWRRLTVLKVLRDCLPGPRFATIRALVSRPETAAQAYVAMVEENEIRVGLSHYERARIVAHSVSRGVFADGKDAMKALFGNVSRAKRSKIRSFLRLYDCLDDVLHFPAAIGERLGLRLAARIEAGDLAMIRAGLEKMAPKTASAELAALETALKNLETMSRRKRGIVEREEIGPGIMLTYRRSGKKHSLMLTGPGLDAASCDRLRRVLANDKK